MNAILLEQTTSRLTGEVRRWDRRLRLVQSLLWGPRGMMAGLIIAIGVALLSRTRPWLLPKEVAQIAGGLTLLGSVVALAAVWIWPPHSTRRRARYFDRKFDLKERVSTALEVTHGAIPLPDRLVEHQLSDAVQRARRVRVQDNLPLRLRLGEVLFLGALAALIGYLLIAPNPKADELISRRNLQNAISAQAQNLQQSLQQVQANGSLTPEQRQALSQPLQQALNTLQQPDISQQEAMAALSQAEQELQRLSNGMTQEQQSAYQQAGSQLSQSDLTSNAGQALSQPDLNQAAQSMNDMANQLAQGNLTDAERQQMADQLEQAAKQLQGTNPALAKDLQDAANALRNGDTQAAQDALNKAAQDLQNQQQQLQNSEMAQTAQNLQNQVNQNRQDLANQNNSSRQPQNQQSQQGQQGQNQQSQQGQPNQQGQPAQSQPGQQSQEGQNQTGQQQQGDQSQQSSQDQSQQSGQQQGQQGQQGQPGQQNQQNGQQQMQGGQQGGDQASQQSGQQSSSSGQAGGQDQSQQQSGSQQGSSQASQQSGQQQGNGNSGADQSSHTSQNQSTQGQSNQAGAGQGEGGAGSDTTSGATTDQQGNPISTDNNPGAGNGNIQQYSPQYNPSTIGGQTSGNQVDVGGQNQNNGGAPVQQGDFGPNPSGQSQLSYSSVYNNYTNIVNGAMQSGRIPLDQRDVIHDYFSSLEPKQ